MTRPAEELPQRAFESHGVVEPCAMLGCAESCARWAGTMWEPADVDRPPDDGARSAN